jgi:hypothetical protein
MAKLSAILVTVVSLFTAVQAQGPCQPRNGAACGRDLLSQGEPCKK